MNVLVIGAGGLTGKKIVKQLAESNQHLVRAMIRKAEQTDEMERLGAKAILADLEQDFSFALNDVNAVIFAAGSGSSTGHDKTIAVDQEGAKKTVDFAKEKGIERFIMLSSMGADTIEEAPASLVPYLEAKKAADEYLIKSGLSFTIVRPGGLTDDPGTGMIELATRFSPMGGTIPREDVAQVLVESLTMKETEGKVFEIISGYTPINKALTRI
ncbi:NAD-dependent dehydratase [Bacillus sp. FJAT-27231]|uniref:SDR family oxidoreductase n=1 Tax=Bacillus sp. FJAT-27231 TaxID=1679168 RepID=UPI000670D9E3|nr:SDR family oxidoreductase [Bacillus sp. FJAT-27231]KMY55173.1 NAD-dependent dehydratase [Bacillus sp. FJAT-27231]